MDICLAAVRAAASRRNGAKSRGLKTIEGKEPADDTATGVEPGQPAPAPCPRPDTPGSSNRSNPTPAENLACVQHHPTR
jgi:hypothetical protein